MKPQRGFVFDANGNQIGTASCVPLTPEAPVQAWFTVPVASVKEPIKIVWDSFETGLVDYPAVVIA